MMTLAGISRFNERMARVVYLTLAVISVTGCAAPMASTKEELQALSEKEGVVFGSILLVAQKGPQDESGWGFLRGRKTDELKWTVSFGELGINPFGQTYAIAAMPGKEEVFIKKLPAGSYNILRASPESGIAGIPSNQYVSLSIFFKVQPQQASYIGRLVINVPDRILPGSVIRASIADFQEETVEKLRGEHPEIVGKTVKDLATTSTLR
jgi:hypothetical protein